MTQVPSATCTGQTHDIILHSEVEAITLTTLTATLTMRKLHIVRPKSFLAQPEGVGIHGNQPPGFGAAVTVQDLAELGTIADGISVGVGL